MATSTATDWSNPQLPSVAQLRAAGERRRDASAAPGFQGYGRFYAETRPEELAAAGAAAGGGGGIGGIGGGGGGVPLCKLLPARPRGRDRGEQGAEVWQNNSFHIIAFKNRVR